MYLGRINIQYRRVECTPPEPINMNLDVNIGVGSWLRVIVEVCFLPTPALSPYLPLSVPSPLTFLVSSCCFVLNPDPAQLQGQRGDT